MQLGSQAVSAPQLSLYKEEHAADVSRIRLGMLHAVSKVQS